MRSSESVDRLTLFARRLLVAGGLLLTACSTPPVASQTTSTAPAPECVAADAGVPPQNPETVASLRRTVETGPLYTILATKANVVSCRVGNDASGVALEYTFRDGGWLHVKRDPRIEYSNQEARFASPLVEDPVSVLTRAEQVTFAPSGCGIDWRTTDTQPAGDDPGATDTIYRGDVCNCQARVRKDAAGRVVGLVFRSTC